MAKNCTDSPSETRVKRQSYSSANAGAVQDGNNFIDSIFQIPISTLNAVGSLIKNTRPIVMRARERIQQQYDQYQQQQQQQGSKPRPSRGSNYYNTNKRVNKNKRRRSGIQGRDYPSY
ncbi:uncharacterized protein LOC103506135 [Diaphorina citri]|uniref:Uncharacterized protein LOC103506135 n=1 Tax=Diaphorina citri TaxID=121845 RepID=A0A1S3CVQ4_DIACI|nr:uncharacterized protein LOC103506135 [Diaphorina citri]